MKKFKLYTSVLTVMVLFAPLSSVAEAHVTLNPNVSTPGSYAQYDVRVPVERDSNTVKIELEVPKDVTLSGVQPVPGFEHTFEKNKNGEITKVTWTATGKGIGQNEYMNFPIVVANPKKEGTYQWKAIQTYEDGKVVKWTDDDKKSETPAPTTVVKANGAMQQEETSHHHDTADSEETTAASSPWLERGMSIVALILAIIALFKRKNFTKSDK
ncbi:YcnI family protein [Staphylococcus lutrae]|uniref:Nuclear export factor GLE1 n=1 Tax=Staphylococcus lutrae TaxID=155085 RepID=A0AAC9RRT9_9STAP|nr:YcnI family protein [Staphylococcus lutrae]ARJ50524.1 nuclear export factor GLE1 [Staphylococcus lutrae]PNZ37426.1 DUF1775 domain-containing protein [Staphylococcus lutrae]